jgi:hypothetical protein
MFYKRLGTMVNREAFGILPMAKVLRAVILIMLFAVTISLSAQTNGTWPLTSNGNCTATGYVTGSTMSTGGGVGPVSYGPNGAYANNWTGSTLAQSIASNDYFQFTLTATANVSITTVSFYAQANHPNGALAAMYLSVGGGPYTQIGTQYNLLNGVEQQFTISGLNTAILNGNNYSLRIYGWGLSAANKLIYVRGVSISAYYSSTSDYFRTINSWSWTNVNTWESSPDGVNWYYSSLYPTSAANTTYINNGNVVTLNAASACGNLTYNSGSIALGNYNLTINGTISGIPYFIYSGTGVPSQTGTESHVTVTYEYPTSLPETLNTLTADCGIGDTVTMPNSITTTYLEFNTGSIAPNGNTITLAAKDFGISSDAAVISALDVTLSNTVNTWGPYASIAHTWITSASFTDTVSVHLTYPETLSISDYMKVWVRDENNTGDWILLGIFPVTDNGSSRTVIVDGVSSLNGSVSGNLNWTITETDQTLPVELSTFLAMITPLNFIMLEWVTQSETNLSGFYLFRSMDNDISTAERINIFVPATNTSQETSYIFTDREAIPGHTWYYWLQHIELNGEQQFHGPVSIFLSTSDDFIPPIPLHTGISEIYPNPCSAPATVAYGLNKAEYVSITVLNSRGEVVKRLLSDSKDAGSYRLRWDGKNDRGLAVATGVYFIRMTAGKTVSTGKIIIAK